MTDNITRIHPERHVPYLKAEQEERGHIDHRAWTTIIFSCPYCLSLISTSASMQQPAGRSGVFQYTLVAQHICYMER